MTSQTALNSSVHSAVGAPDSQWDGSDGMYQLA